MWIMQHTATDLGPGEPHGGHQNNDQSPVNAPSGRNKGVLRAFHDGSLHGGQTFHSYIGLSEKHPFSNSGPPNQPQEMRSGLRKSFYVNENKM